MLKTPQVPVLDELIRILQTQPDDEARLSCLKKFFPNDLSSSNLALRKYIANSEGCGGSQGIHRLIGLLEVFSSNASRLNLMRQLYLSDSSMKEFYNLVQDDRGSLPSEPTITRVTRLLSLFTLTARWEIVQQLYLSPHAQELEKLSALMALISRDSSNLLELLGCFRGERGIVDMEIIKQFLSGGAFTVQFTKKANIRDFTSLFNKKNQEQLLTTAAVRGESGAAMGKPVSVNDIFQAMLLEFSNILVDHADVSQESTFDELISSLKVGETREEFLRGLSSKVARQKLRWLINNSSPHEFGVGGLLQLLELFPEEQRWNVVSTVYLNPADERKTVRADFSALTGANLANLTTLLDALPKNGDMVAELYRSGLFRLTAMDATRKNPPIEGLISLLHRFPSSVHEKLIGFIRSLEQAVTEGELPITSMIGIVSDRLDFSLHIPLGELSPYGKHGNIAVSGLYHPCPRELPTSLGDVIAILPQLNLDDRMYAIRMWSESTRFKSLRQLISGYGHDVTLDRLLGFLGVFSKDVACQIQAIETLYVSNDLAELRGFIGNDIESLTKLLKFLSCNGMVIRFFYEHGLLELTKTTGPQPMEMTGQQLAKFLNYFSEDIFNQISPLVVSKVELASESPISGETIQRVSDKLKDALKEWFHPAHAVSFFRQPPFLATPRPKTVGELATMLSKGLDDFSKAKLLEQLYPCDSALGGNDELRLLMKRHEEGDLIDLLKAFGHNTTMWGIVHALYLMGNPVVLQELNTVVGSISNLCKLLAFLPPDGITTVVSTLMNNGVILTQENMSRITTLELVKFLNILPENIGGPLLQQLMPNLQPSDGIVGGNLATWILGGLAHWLSAPPCGRTAGPPTMY